MDYGAGSPPHVYGRRADGGEGGPTPKARAVTHTGRFSKLAGTISGTHVFISVTRLRPTCGKGWSQSPSIFNRLLVPHCVFSGSVCNDFIRSCRELPRKWSARSRGGQGPWANF